MKHYFASAAPTAPLDVFHKVFALFRFSVIFIGIANRTVRQEWLSQYHFETLDQVRDYATRWLWTYNNERPNLGIGGIIPTAIRIDPFDVPKLFTGKAGLEAQCKTHWSRGITRIRWAILEHRRPGFFWFWPRCN